MRAEGGTAQIRVMRPGTVPTVISYAGSGDRSAERECSAGGV